MKPIIAVITVFLLAFSARCEAEQEAVHPLLTDRFYLAGGVFIPEKEFKLSVNDVSPSERINFGEAFRFSSSEFTGALNFRWRFGQKWSVWAQYWAVNDSKKATLDEDIVWRETVFEEGSFVKGNAGIDVARLFFGRTFHTSEDHEFGLGLGLHWLKLSAGIEGQILSNVGDAELYRDSVSTDAPLPNIGTWYTHAFSSKWALTARVDWLSASIGDYSGGLWNGGVGVDWFVHRNIGVGISYNFFELDIEVDKSDWRGDATIQQHGPFLQISASW